MYVSLVDTASHTHGATSPEALAAAAQADGLVGKLVAGLARLGLDRRANIVVVSDHGMADARPERVIVLDEYLDLRRVDVLETGPMLRLRPSGPRRPEGGRGYAAANTDAPADGNADPLVAALAGKHPHLAVYHGDDVPARYRYQGSARIPPVVGVADEGWLVLTRAERDQWIAEGGSPRAEHGFDPQAPAMHGLFVAHGPAFREGLRVRAFESVHLYALFCRLLGIAPSPNDGDARVTAQMLR